MSPGNSMENQVNTIHITPENLESYKTMIAIREDETPAAHSLRIATDTELFKIFQAVESYEGKSVIDATVNLNNSPALEDEKQTDLLGLKVKPFDPNKPLSGKDLAGNQGDE